MATAVVPSTIKLEARPILSADKTCAQQVCGQSREARILSLTDRVEICASLMMRKMPFQVIREDMVQAAWLGAIYAVDHYVAGAVQLKSFATWRIRGAMLDYLRSLDPLCRKYRAAVKAGLEPEPVTVPIDGLQLSAPNPEFWRSEVRADIAALARRAHLGPRTLLILRLYYAEASTDREIGIELALTQSRVAQLRWAALRAMRRAEKRKICTMEPRTEVPKSAIVATPHLLEACPMPLKLVSVLTRRQHELVRGICEDGLSTEGICERMGITAGTVKVYLSHVYDKLGLPDRVALMHWYWKRRIAVYETPASEFPKAA